MNTLFDQTGDALRDLSLAIVEANADPDWFNAAGKAVRFLAASRGDGFTSDDVWDTLARYAPDVTTHEPRAMGALLRNMARDKVVRTDGYRKGHRPANHSRPQTIWRQA